MKTKISQHYDTNRLLNNTDNTNICLNNNIKM